MFPDEMSFPQCRRHRKIFITHACLSTDYRHEFPVTFVRTRCECTSRIENFLLRMMDKYTLRFGSGFNCAKHFPRPPVSVYRTGNSSGEFGEPVHKSSNDCSSQERAAESVPYSKPTEVMLISKWSR